MKFLHKFLLPSGPVEMRSEFNRSVWHTGDILRANTLYKVYEHQGQSSSESAGLAIKHIIYEQMGAIFESKQVPT
jgi:hypothetical protein